MGQHPVYNGVIKSKGAIKMTHRELRTILKQHSEYQLKQITQAATRFLALNQDFRLKRGRSSDILTSDI